MYNTFPMACSQGGSERVDNPPRRLFAVEKHVHELMINGAEDNYVNDIIPFSLMRTLLYW